MDSLLRGLGLRVTAARTPEKGLDVSTNRARIRYTINEKKVIMHACKVSPSSCYVVM